MPSRARRSDALTKDRIVAAAIEILDAEGPGALTFRALGARLETGSGAIYHHVAGKRELLAAAADAVLGPVLAAPKDSDPRQAIRALALRLFDTIDVHPWVAPQLGADPRQPANRLVAERIGAAVMALDPPEKDLFHAASAVESYILGSASENAANARNHIEPGAPDRERFLGEIAAEWRALDPGEFPFLRKIAASMADHDDREQFLAGLDLILTGIAAL
ncbi:TetR/AcrR family transcriptional regulator [Tsukamurella sp. 1534]|uniref:TetR/AcrR family transcriptional regulator n=1 Tax=Tsukamurella sp. 1534 TaxID=1151061 RepID=UPI001C5B501F|nr:TetR/AcrR family transcriptional regulator [Tsukamurella sp. 1534]